MWFKWIHPAPLSQPVKSRDAWLYYYRSMKCLGWKSPKRLHLRLLYFIWSVITFSLGAVYLSVGMTITYVLQYNEITPAEFLTSFQTILDVYGFVLKIIIINSQLWRFDKIREVLDEMDARCHNDSEKLKIHTAVAKSNYIFMLYLMVYLSYDFSSFLTGLFSGRTPWQIYNPFYTNDTLEASLIELGVGLFAVSMNQLADSYAVVFIIIIRAHINILKTRIENLRVDENQSNDKHLEDLIQCVIDHKNILKYCDSLRPMLSGTIFIQFLLIGSTLGLTLINMYFFSDIWMIISNIVYIVGLLCQTFPFCYLYDLLEEDCHILTYTLFHSCWIDAEKRYKQVFIYFLFHLHQPIVFLASGIFPICMSSNITVAKFAFSVVTIAKQFNYNEKL